jgi:hypothetical protein
VRQRPTWAKVTGKPRQTRHSGSRPGEYREIVGLLNAAPGSRPWYANDHGHVMQGCLAEATMRGMQPGFLPSKFDGNLPLDTNHGHGGKRGSPESRAEGKQQRIPTRSWRPLVSFSNLGRILDHMQSPPTRTTHRRPPTGAAAGRCSALGSGWPPFRAPNQNHARGRQAEATPKPTKTVRTCFLSAMA